MTCGYVTCLRATTSAYFTLQNFEVQSGLDSDKCNNFRMLSRRPWQSLAAPRLGTTGLNDEFDGVWNSCGLRRRFRSCYGDFGFYDHSGIRTKMVWSQGGHIKRRLLYKAKLSSYSCIVHQKFWPLKVILNGLLFNICDLNCN